MNRLFYCPFSSFLSLVTVIGLGLAAAANAADTSSGCGMGYQVAPKQSLISSSTRSIVNATFSSTIGMTLGTSGCAKHSIVKNDAKGVHFAEANLNQLAIDMARGNGEYVQGFASVLGCQNAALFGAMVQKNYIKFFPQNGTSGAELYNNVKSEVIKENRVLNCSLI